MRHISTFYGHRVHIWRSYIGSRQGWSQDVKSHKTETRPRRSKKRIEIAVSQFKNTNWWSLSLDNLFLAGQIHYFLPDISASLMHCVHGRSQDLKSRNPRPRRYIFKTETRPIRYKNVSRPPRDRDVQDRDYIPPSLPSFLPYLLTYLLTYSVVRGSWMSHQVSIV